METELKRKRGRPPKGAAPMPKRVKGKAHGNYHFVNQVKALGITPLELIERTANELRCFHPPTASDVGEALGVTRNTIVNHTGGEAANWYVTSEYKVTRTRDPQNTRPIPDTIGEMLDKIEHALTYTGTINAACYAAEIGSRNNFYTAKARYGVDFEVELVKHIVKIVIDN